MRLLDSVTFRGLAAYSPTRIPESRLSWMLQLVMVVPDPITDWKTPITPRSWLAGSGEDMHQGLRPSL